MTRSAALAAVLLLVLATDARAALDVRASLDPPVVFFGDPVVARVVVVTGRDRAGDVRVVQSLAPLTQLGPTRVDRATRGGLATVTYTTPAACLADACVGDGATRGVSLRRVSATGGGARATASWPPLEVRSRVTAADLARARPPFRGDATPPPPTYRVAPATLARGLEVAAVVLAAAAVALGGFEVTRVARRRRAAAADDALGRALRLAREAEARPPADRRRALGLVARVLHGADERLEGRARELAWARPQPEPRAVEELVVDVEREVRA